MLMLASGVGSILRNAYYLCNPTDSWHMFDLADRPSTTRETVERLILGMLKVTTALSIYSALYVANARLQRWEPKAGVMACAFCIYPLATLDVPLMKGIFEAYTALFVMHRKNAEEVNKIGKKIREQAQSEGYRFYNSWERFWYKTDCPPETDKRCLEIADIVKQTPEVKQILERINPLIKQSYQLLIKGSKKFGISCASEIVITSLSSRLPQLFWLDGQLVKASRWLASRIV